MRTEYVRFFSSKSAMPSTWLPLHLPPPYYASSTSATGTAAHLASSATAVTWGLPPADVTAADIVAMQTNGCNGSTAAGAEGVYDFWHRKPRVGAASLNGSFGAVPLWLFSTYMICPHGGVCDGRWGWRPPPVLIGHLVGSKAKFWILRLLGWWHYDAARLPPVEAASADVKGPVFPASAVRPLVLRGHELQLGKHPADVRKLRRALVRWVLLAIALGRRAVIPLVPCDIPTPEARARRY